MGYRMGEKPETGMQPSWKHTSAVARKDTRKAMRTLSLRWLASELAAVSTIWESVAGVIPWEDSASHVPQEA